MENNKRKKSWKRIFALLLYVWLFFLFDPFIISKNLKFNRYSTSDGLSNNFCLSILKDSDGFLWVGTADGLNRFDGYDFLVFSSDDFNPGSTGHSQIFSLLEDSDKNLWVGNWGGGINIYNRESNRFSQLRHSDNDPGSLRSDNVMIIIEDHEGFIWVGSDGGGLERINKNNMKITRFKLIDNSGNEVLRVNTVLEDRLKRLWVGTENGLFRFGSDRSGYKIYSKDEFKLSSNEILSLYEDRDGILWAGTRKGINRFDNIIENFVTRNHYLNSEISSGELKIFSINEDSSANFWIGTNWGLFRFEKNSFKFIGLKGDSDNMKLLLNSSIMNIIEDRNKNLWIASVKGLFKLNLTETDFRSYFVRDVRNTSLKSGQISSVLKGSRDELYIGTTYFGIIKYIRRLDKYFPDSDYEWRKNSLKGNWIADLIKDRSGNLWVGTRNKGLSILKKGNQEFRNFIDDNSADDALRMKRILALYEDKRGNIWIGSDGEGMTMVDNKLNEVSHFVHSENKKDSLCSNFVICFYEDSKDNFWIGTYGGGLELFDRKKGTFTHFKNDRSDVNSISGNIIHSVIEDRDGIIWIGTFGAGLNKFDPRSGKFIHFNKKHGLPDNSVFSIIIDGSGYLWLSTSNGISRFDPKEEKFINYFEEDGLQGNEFVVSGLFDKRTEEVFFGGVEGFTVFNPENIKSSRNKPEIRITYIEKYGKNKVFRRSVKENSSVSFSYRDSFSIGFILMDFTQPRQYRYEYIIEDRDKEWINIGNSNTLTFDSMDPGRYVLKLKGVNKSGIWSEPVNINLIVYPPFWLTWWFKLILLIFIISLVILLYRMKLKRAIQKMEYKSRIEYFCKKSGLSERECEVMGLLLEGKNNKEIEDLLFISQNTVRNHNYNIYQKLNINSFQTISLIVPCCLY